MSEDGGGRRIVPVAGIVGATIDCSLDLQGRTERAERWVRLRERFLSEAQLVAGGVRLVFDVRAEEDLVEVAAREAECCPGLRIEVSRGDPVVVEVTGARDVQQMIRALAGLP